ncbi:MAG: metal-dependent transcriptional regulator [bacterium]|nr:metal-dependent transcriptional regulator [bacterium]
MMKTINDSTYWREFDQNDITHSAAHYLMAIDTLREQYGYARVTDVAGMLSITRAAASMAMSHLKKRGLVTEDRNRFLLLTDDGIQMAHQVENNFRTLATFFEEVLGLESKVAMADACKMEHLMSPDTRRRLLWLMRHILSDKTYATSVQEAMQEFEAGCHGPGDPCPMCEPDECLAEGTEPQADK